MSRITAVSATNFKGSTFRTELAPVTVITGDNFKGKSSRVEALVLALCRCLPGVASKPSDLHERLASADKMGVGVEFVDGRSISLTFDKRKDKVETSGINNGFPADFRCPTIAFDASEFLTLSAKERVKFLFRTLPPPPLEQTGPAAIIAELKNVKLEPHTEDAEKAIDALCDYVKLSYANHVTQNNLPVQEWLELLNEEIRLKANAAVATAKTMKSTALGVTQLKEPDAAGLAQAEGAKQAAQRALDAAKQVLANARAQYTAVQTELAQAKRLAAGADTSAATAEVTRLNEEVARVTRTLAQLDTPSLNVTNAAEEVAARREEVRLFDTRLAEPFDKELCPTLATALRTAEEQLRAATSAKQDLEWKRGMIEGRIAKTKALGLCEACSLKLSASDLDDLAALPSMDVLWQAIVAATTARDAAVGPSEQANAAAKNRAALEADRALANNELGAAERELRRLENEQSNEKNVQQRSLNLLTNKLADAQSRISRVTDSDAQAARVPVLEANLATLKDDGVKAAAVVETLQTTLATADTVHRKALADAAAAQTARKAIAASDKAQAEAAVTKALSDIINGVLDKAVELSIQPMLNTCNSLCGDILTASLVYDTESNDIGMLRGSRFVSWRSFSGTERALAYAALQIVLATQSPVKIAIIDECGRLDNENKFKLATSLVRMQIDGTIDQAIVIDTSPLEWRMPYETLSVVEL